ncbi:MAG: RluA family pseudouridine synthase [Anaerolineaceae bacterium]|nr:RluA family pseudouridine synthase [Anaerolineaceae bacterium]
MNEQTGTDQVLTFTYQQPETIRLDKFLVECLPDYSRSRIQGWIGEERVTVNGEIAEKTGIKLDSGATVVVSIPPIKESKLVPEEIPLDIIFENNDLIILNKAPGIVVHPTAGHEAGTLVHAVLAHAPELEGVGGEHRPGVVHRLDKGTSGLIIFAKNDAAHQWLQKQFKNRLVRKEYLTLVDGHPPTPTGRIEAPIGRDPNHRKQMAVMPPGKGRKAVSEYHVEASYARHALIRVRIFTGRTHQIRLHMRFINCPVVGDTLYGHRHPSLPVNRQFLHAAHLEITLPGEHEPRSFDAPLPNDLNDVLNLIR